ncbi:MAG: tetratricopeptide repeat protein [Deferribacteres bacterium]|nr:tetratricopeptide repeat protein [candidate division KSB1 bacterium]MCB9503709.1 tetratricopeptide repeat protein [Deferribacteres bacterium]
MFTKSLLRFLALFMVVSAPSISAQISKGSSGVGLILGANQQYSESRLTPFAFGAGAFYSRNLSDRFNLLLEGGYNELAIKVGNPLKKYSTNLIYFDLLAGYDLMQHAHFRPFLHGGIGAFNFKMIGSTNSDRYFDGEFILGGGMRWHFNNNLALRITGDFKYTTGDGLDGNIQGGNTVMDSYFTVRGGMSYYFGGHNSGLDEEYFSGNVEVEDLPEGGDLSQVDQKQNDTVDGLFAQLSDLDNIETTGASAKEQEYERLKMRLESLKGSIDSKETEIYSLQNSMVKNEEKNGELLLIDNNYSQELVNDISSFSMSYEAALNKFYHKQYQDAIDRFQALMVKYPDHALSSNCEYWVGECYFHAADFTRALVSFERVVTIEQSLKKDDALLMMGRSYKELGQADAATEILNRLLKEFPDSEHLQEARELL